MRPWRTEHAVAKISLSILTAIPTWISSHPADVYPEMHIIAAGAKAKET